MAAHSEAPQSQSDVRESLTPRRVRETTGRDSYAEFMERSLKAFGRRVEQGDTTALAALVKFRQEAERIERQGVAALRAKPNNFSWAEIAKPLGITRQTAQEKYGRYCKEGRKPGGQPAHLR